MAEVALCCDLAVEEGGDPGLKAGFLMSGKKRHEVHLQVEVNTPEEWNQLCKRDGLIVVDVFSDWCGPCEAMIPLLKKIKNELPSGGPDILCFAAAKSDSIKSLSSYHGKSEPTWLFISVRFLLLLIALFYGHDVPSLLAARMKKVTALTDNDQIVWHDTGILVENEGGKIIQELYGANAPLLYRTIQKEFEKEKLVVKGELKREPYEHDEIKRRPNRIMNGFRTTSCPMNPCIIPSWYYYPPQLYPGQELMLEVETPVTVQVEVRRCSSSRIKEAMRQYILTVFEPRMVDSEEKMTNVLDFICSSPNSTFKIAECKLYQFSEAEAMDLFNIDNRELMESQNAEKILNVYTEGKAMILVVAQKPGANQEQKSKDAHVIKKAWGTFLGPESASEARSLAPDSFRAKFLKPDLDQGTWCDMSQEVQVRMMRQHFPDFVDNLVSGTGTASLKELAHCVELLCVALKPLGSKGITSFEDEGARREDPHDECPIQQQQTQEDPVAVDAIQIDDDGGDKSPASPTTKDDTFTDSSTLVENPTDNSQEPSHHIEIAAN